MDIEWSMEEVTIRKGPGSCRCCLAEGFFRSLTMQYDSKEIDKSKEVYIEMISECFGIAASQYEDIILEHYGCICEGCVTRLRDACSFKRQVLDAQSKIEELVMQGEVRPGVTQVKNEPRNIDTESDGEDKSLLHDIYWNFGEDSHDDDHMTLEQIRQRKRAHEDTHALKDCSALKLESQLNEDDESLTAEALLARLQADKDSEVVGKPAKRGRGRPRKDGRANVPRVKPKTEPSNNGLQTEYKCASTRRRRNFAIIFNYTSLIPFKWRGKYICFYCDEKFDDCALLRRHAKSHGHCSVNDKCLIPQRKVNQAIKLDVSEIYCEICKQPFEDVNQVVNHLVMSHKKNYNTDVDVPLERYRLSDLKCLVCEKKMRTFRVLVTHINKNHPENNHPCEHCGKQFNKMRDLGAHVRNFHRQGGYQCKLCLKECATNAILRVHIKRKHLRTCEICAKQFSSQEFKLRHMLTYHGDVKVKFEDSNAEAFLDADIQELDSQDLHMRRERAKKNRANIACILNMTTAIPFKFFNQYRCFFCPKSFSGCEPLKEHTVLSHPVYNDQQKCLKSLKGSAFCIKIDISSLSCKVCYQSFEELDPLIDHLIVKHDAKYDKSITGIVETYKLASENMPCPICNVEFFDYFGSLIRHIHLKHPSNRFVCVYCGLTLSSAPLLRSHVSRTHSEKEYKCSECDAKFFTTMKLTMHKAKEHGVKFAQCTECSESFTSNYAKRKHMMKTHNIGFKCTYCDKMYTKHSFMRSHIKRTHLKEKNAECNVCGMRFFDNVLLRNHMVQHTGVKSFHCDVCAKSFFWKKNLKGHMAAHRQHLKPDIVF